jgi:hypothetical protein
MSCATLIGALSADGWLTVRYLHWGDHPARLIPLRRIWTGIDRNSYRLSAVVLWASSGPTCRGLSSPPLGGRFLCS